MLLDNKLMAFVKAILSGVDEERNVLYVTMAGMKDEDKEKRLNSIDRKCSFLYFQPSGEDTKIYGADGMKVFEITTPVKTVESVGIAFDKIAHLENIVTIDSMQDGTMYCVQSEKNYAVVDDITFDPFPSKLDDMIKKVPHMENLFGAEEPPLAIVSKSSKDFDTAILKLGSYTKTITKKHFVVEGNYGDWSFRAIMRNYVQTN